MLYLAAGLVLLALFFWGLGRYASANPAVVARRMRIGGGVAAGAAGGFMILRGNVGMALTLFSVAGWLLSGAQLPWTTRRTTPSPGQTSRVTTDHLEMELDHGTGDMRGRVLKGFFAGRDLASLKPVELAHLWQDCRFDDPQSAQLVEAYLDRVHPTWREDLARAEAEAPKGPDGRMTRAEALDILGLVEGASADEIRDAHRRLMLKVHPDRGGSTYLAAKINEAKDVALDGKTGA